MSRRQSSRRSAERAARRDPLVRWLAPLLLTGWALWSTVVVLTNIADALRALHILSSRWKFASGNFALIRSATAIYHTPDWISALLFAGVIVWEAAMAALFWRAASAAERPGRRSDAAISLAFTVSLPLWLAVLVADELFIAYQVEAAHLLIFIGQAATLALLLLVRGATPPTADQTAPPAGD